MNINKKEILENLCYTEFVYWRINKKLNTNFSKVQIERLMFRILKSTEWKFYLKIGKNFYISSIENNIKITINSNTFGIIYSTANKFWKNLLDARAMLTALEPDILLFFKILKFRFLKRFSITVDKIY